MKLSSVSLTIAAIASSPCDGFLTFINRANPDITNYAIAQESALLKIHLDIGQEVSIKNGKSVLAGDRLGIDGLTVELKGRVDANYKHPNLPGANGPNPQLSSGAKTMELIQKGKFVDLAGSQIVNLEEGVWEMNWRNNAKSGMLVCGFDVPEEIKRNGANIPKGKLYINFPLYSQATLQHLRERKAKAEEKAVEAIDRVKEAQGKMGQETNFLMKAMHFHNAMKAHEDIEYSGFNQYNRMPLERDMIKLSGGLSLCTEGNIYTKKDNGIFGGDHTLLGVASLSKGTRDEPEKKVMTERELKSVAYDGLRPFS